MKKLFLSLMLLFTTLSLSAQFGNVEPVTFEELVSVNGADGTIEFEAYIEQGYHLYSTNIPEGGPTPTEVTFSIVEGAEIVGALTAGDGAVTEMDPMFEMMVSYFSETAVFTQKVKFLGGKYRIKGTLRFQSCSDSNCVPGRYDFDITGETVVEKPIVKEVAKPAEPVVKKEEKAAAKPVNNEPAKPAKKAEDIAVAPVAVVEPVVEEKTEQPVVAESNEVKTSIWEPVVDKLALQNEADDPTIITILLMVICSLILMEICMWRLQSVYRSVTITAG